MENNQDNKIEQSNVYNDLVKKKFIRIVKIILASSLTISTLLSAMGIFLLCFYLNLIERPDFFNLIFEQKAFFREIAVSFFIMYLVFSVLFSIPSVIFIYLYSSTAKEIVDKNRLKHLIIHIWGMSCLSIFAFFANAYTEKMDLTDFLFIILLGLIIYTSCYVQKSYKKKSKLGTIWGKMFGLISLFLYLTVIFNLFFSITIGLAFIKDSENSITEFFIVSSFIIIIATLMLIPAFVYSLDNSFSIKSFMKIILAVLFIPFIFIMLPIKGLPNLLHKSLVLIGIANEQQYLYVFDSNKNEKIAFSNPLWKLQKADDSNKFVITAIPSVTISSYTLLCPSDVQKYYRSTFNFSLITGKKNKSDKMPITKFCKIISYQDLIDIEPIE